MDQSNRGALVTGAIVGLLGALLSLVLSLVGSLCCLAGMANWVVPAGAGLLAGLLAAFRADWSEVPSDGRMGYGIGLGLRGGAVASLVTGLAYLCVAVVMPVITLLLQALLSAGGEDFMTVLMASVMVMAMSWVMAFVIALGSTIFGVILGVGGGAVVAATKGNEG